VPDSDTLYIAKHNGIPYFDSINQHPSELAKMLPLPRLQQDLSTGQVANFNYVIPDECTDMHGAPPVCVDSGNPGDVNDIWLVSTADQFAGNLVQQVTTAKGGSVWAAGRVTEPAHDDTSTLVESLHDGSWTVVPTPNPGNSAASGFGGITATSPDAGWAVGSTNDGITSNRTLIEQTC
jgi:hypothetical protein